MERLNGMTPIARLGLLYDLLERNYGQLERPVRDISSKYSSTQVLLLTSLNVVFLWPA